MKILGIFRGFPGLGRVVAGVSLLEELRDRYGYRIKIISYLQGKDYLERKGYNGIPMVCPADYCSIGLLPTNNFGVYIADTIKSFSPDIILIDGEPLILHSIKISFPQIKVVVLLNPSDVENPTNDKEAMDFFNAYYSMADFAIIHGLKEPIIIPSEYGAFITIPTILRREIIDLQSTKHSNNIFCILGGGTINTGVDFIESTIRIGKMIKDLARLVPEYTYHILCGSKNIYDFLQEEDTPINVSLHEQILLPEDYYTIADAIITRSGRNTLSELAYLGIPTIAFITGDKYRVVEQTNNSRSLGFHNIVTMDSYSTVEEVAVSLKNILNNDVCSGTLFRPGNIIALEKIRQFIECN